MIFGYARVSFTDQNLARQLKELEADAIRYIPKNSPERIFPGQSTVK